MRERRVARHPCGVTFVDLREREVRLSWAEVLRRAEHAAAALASLGIAPGDRVAIVLRTEPAFLDARDARPGDLGLLAAMGPGFSAELLLLRW